jgi:hypothetical protein
MLEQTNDEPCCKYCHGPIAVRNPKGYCNHLDWPTLLSLSAKKANGVESFEYEADQADVLKKKEYFIFFDDASVSVGEDASFESIRNAVNVFTGRGHDIRGGVFTIVEKVYRVKGTFTIEERAIE